MCYRNHENMLIPSQELTGLCDGAGTRAINCTPKMLFIQQTLGVKTQCYDYTSRK